MMRLFLILIFSLLTFNAVGQNDIPQPTRKNSNHDTTYLQTFHHLVNARIFMARKFTNLTIVENNGPIWDTSRNILSYQPNSAVIIGAGVTFKGLTLNLGYGFSFLNQEDGKGTTDYLDIQVKMYGRKQVIEIYKQFYTGMYLESTEPVHSFVSNQNYIRPDLNISILGGGYTRVFNDARFSYAASFVQSEYQKKSSGSFLLGGKAIQFAANADSTIIPTSPKDSLFEAFKGLNEMASFQIGPSVGYAHTFVFHRNWFLTLSLEMNFMLGSAAFSLENNTEFKNFTFNLSPDIKMAVGYNSASIYFGLALVDNRSNLPSNDGTIFASFGTGNVRLNFVKRFELSQLVKKYPK